MKDYLTREKATRAIEITSLMAALSNSETAEKATKVASDVNKITGGKYNTRKFAKDFRNV